jgi:small-conductance mechanosensitive channel
MQGLIPSSVTGPMEFEWGAALALAVLLGYLVARRRVKMLPFIPLVLFLLYFLSRLLCPLVNLVPGVHLSARWAGMVHSILLVWAAIRLAVYLFVECPYRMAHRTSLPRLSRDFLLLLFFAASGFILLRTRGQVNLTGLITTSAVLTMIIGLAVQSTLGNFFSGLAIQMERPFCVGDWITLEGITGKVANITWKATYLITRENVQVHVPNSRIDASIYYNFRLPDLAGI